MEKVIKDFLGRNKIDLHNKTVCVGISTGVDSSVLLDVLLKLKEELEFNIVLCHVNHKKRKQSEEEEKFIKKFAFEKNLKLEVFHLDNEEIHNDNFQSSSRLKRLTFFNDVMTKNDSSYVFLAHHLNDDIETSIMHLIRGSNLKGYSGIEELSCNKKGRFILRPFLNVLKEDIYKYAKLNNVIYYEDDSNNSDCYTRNRIRHHIVPRLFEENPNFKDQFKQYKETLYNAYLVVSEKRDEFIKKCVNIKDDVISFDVRDFDNLNDYFKAEVLFELLKKYELSKKNIEEIRNFISSNKPNICLNYKNVYFSKQYNEVILKDKQELENNLVNIVIDGIGIYDVNNQYELIVKKFSFDDFKKNENYVTNLNVIWYNSSMLPLILRNRQDGDRIKINKGSKKIKDLLIDEKIPKEKRDNLLMLVKDGEVINVFGVKKSSSLSSEKNNNIVILLREKK